MKKFNVAFSGIINGLKDKSIRLQVFIACFVIIFSLCLKLHYTDLILIIMCCFLVITFEYVNTCIEKICNVIMPQTNDHIKLIKDLSAGFVLIQAILSVIVFFIIIISFI